ncbi:hypothetical protein [Marinovum sp.]|uniref:hypothetical protein n=1 Tax=Marinovum sp. TaxID=2024839 RepID=UPI003A954DFB
MFKTLTAITDKTRAALRLASPSAPRASAHQSRNVPALQGDDPGVLSAELLDRIGRPLRTDTPELEECRTLLDRGRDLARQENWDRLSALIGAADAARACTAAGTPEAELLAAGARSDLSRALEEASSAGVLSRNNRMLDGLRAMDEIADEMPGDPGCAAVVALSHMDAGWAWYKQGWRRGKPEQHLAPFREAFVRAEEILAPFDSDSATSPLLASTRCALLAGQPGADAQVVTRYETLVTLAPQVPGHMRAFGLHLLPCWFGSYAALDLAARRMAAATGETWGSGAYAWVYFDALLQDAGALLALDTGYFVEAVEDILRRHPGQHMVNLFAAGLCQVLAAGRDMPRSQRRPLEKLRNRLIRSEMTETHGWVWTLTDIGYATPGSGHDTGPSGAECGARQAGAALSSVMSREARRRPVQPSPAP